MRLPRTAHTSRPWRVHEFARDFELEDVWKLPTPGGPDDLTRVVQWVTSRRKEPLVVRALFALRWKLGQLFGWDKPDSGVGERVPSLRERLPADLLEAPRGPDLRAVPGREERDGPAATTHRWRCWSSRTDGWARHTWPRSSRSATRWYTRCCCDRSDASGRRSGGMRC